MSDAPTLRWPPPDKYTDAIAWIEQHSRPLTELLDPRIARAAFATTLTSLDGRPYSAKTRRNKRSVLVSALNYAVELELLDRNPMDRIKEAMNWPTPGVDRRCVVNPEHARSTPRTTRSGTLHETPRSPLPRSGRRLVNVHTICGMPPFQRG